MNLRVHLITKENENENEVKLIVVVDLLTSSLSHTIPNPPLTLSHPSLVYSYLLSWSHLSMQYKSYQQPSHLKKKTYSFMLISMQKQSNFHLLSRNHLLPQSINSNINSPLIHTMLYLSIEICPYPHPDRFLSIHVSIIPLFFYSNAISSRISQFSSVHF